MSKGDVYRHRFDSPGTFVYYCLMHPQMVATVEVAGDAREGAPASVPGDDERASGLMSSGDAYGHVFDTPRTYAFFCVIHPNMTGTPTLTVEPGTSVTWQNTGAASATSATDFVPGRRPLHRPCTSRASDPCSA